MQLFFNFQYRHAEAADNFTGGVHDELSTQRVENVSLGHARAQTQMQSRSDKLSIRNCGSEGKVSMIFYVL